MEKNCNKPKRDDEIVTHVEKMQNEKEDDQVKPTLQVAEERGIKIYGEVETVSDDQLKAIESFEIVWETTLEEMPGESSIKSGIYVLNSGSEHESRWQIELDKNHVGANGHHFLSVYLTLVGTYQEGAEIPATFIVKLPTDEDPIIKKSSLSPFSKQRPSFGFRFIEYYRLGPFTKPGNTEKLKFLLKISLFRNASEEEVAAACQPKTASDPVFGTAAPTIDHDAPFKPDAHLLYDDEFIPVETDRISFYSPFLADYIIKNRKKGRFNRQDHNLANSIFDGKGLLLKVVEFCHNGTLSPVPRRMLGLTKLMRIADVLNIVPLRDLCEDTILQRLSMDSFLATVECAKTNLLQPQKAYPVIYEFMLANNLQLQMDQKYRETYPDNREFYEDLMKYCEDVGGGVANTMVSYYLKLAKEASVSSPASDAPTEILELD